MKKIDKEAMEKFAKEKNIDKGKIEEIADGYKDKSEDELMDELIKIGKTLQGKEEVVEKFKTFLDDNQRKKIDSIMTKISAAEAQDKISSKKLKSLSLQINQLKILKTLRILIQTNLTARKNLNLVSLVNLKKQQKKALQVKKLKKL
ncbi:hypothetical protein QJS64_06285 [Paraclostridium bifermentans]|uniref:Uncharacterized protein n=1 Tax=Paraclostridium bifermentans TaxID=1490 RepID=A0ABY8R557_PARBF|nr:hypothetical protein QJS64_06285 [Paraclostridium bifermentans]